MNTNLQTLNTVVTMSSREIAELSILNTFSELIISASSISDLSDALKYFSSNPISGYTALTCAVIGMWGERLREITSELSLSKKFFNNLNTLIPNAKIIDIAADSKNKPDGFLKIKSELYVVEMKARVFDVIALKQLCRYMKHYNAKGLAVAPSLSCSLPDDMTFIKLSIK